MTSIRRRALQALGTSALLCAITPIAGAQASAWPHKPLKIVVPNAPGGTSDILARLITKPLSEALGVPVVVDNRAGAGGNIGAAAVAQSTDNHTVLLCDVGGLAIAPIIFKDMPYSLERDLQGVSMLAYAPHILVVHPAVPANTLSELVALSKKAPINIAIAGNGTPNHLATVQIAQATGLQWTPVPYRGGAPAVGDAVAGAVHAVLNGMPATLPLVQAGKLKVIGVSKATRVGQISQVPTIAEQGVKGFESGTWQGVTAPATMPREMVAKLNAELVRIIRSPELREKLSQYGLAAHTTSPKDTTVFIARERVRWATVVKDAGVAISGTP
jgi:tripartite-type tricarboxylate transporter receptor subunit TctC